MQAFVFAGLFNRSQWSRKAFASEALAEGPQAVDHTCKAGKASEEYKPFSGLVANLLVVDKGAAELQHLGQHRHVVGLALDDVGEKDVGSVRLKEVRRDFFDAENYLRVGQVFGHGGASTDVLFVGENTAC